MPTNPSPPIAMADKIRSDDPLDKAEAFLNRELSWLAFARRVLAMVEDPALPLLERVKFAGIVGMLHDEFFMKRISGLKRQIRSQSRKISLDGRTPAEELEACRGELHQQTQMLTKVVEEELRPALAAAELPICDVGELSGRQRANLRRYFQTTVQPILTPLAVDAEHPFPFISNLGLNLAVLLPDPQSEVPRFIRVKVPQNRPRWVPIPKNHGVVPLEQVIAANLDLLFPDAAPLGVYAFRVTRGAEGDSEHDGDLSVEDALREPGSIVRQVSDELKARRFAGCVRVQVEESMPRPLQRWLAEQLGLEEADVYATGHALALCDLQRLEVPGHEQLRYPSHRSSTHPRLRHLDPYEPAAIFREIQRGDLLLQHPYHSFDSSVLRFLESAAVDPKVLAIKLSIYRTSSESPIVRALVEAARRGKQVAVLVEITARFDEAPNIAWGQLLEREGVHVAYGVERLKTHVKLALVVREEKGRMRSYAHVGTGNYHTGTARLYEDLGVLTCEPELCADVAAVFNSLTGALSHGDYRRMLVAPVTMRDRFVELIRREVAHARKGRPCGIHAKMNQLQDPQMILELYRASQAGVPITLNVRGLCCLRPGVAGLSERIRVFGVVGRFLEHSRIYRFTNGGDVEHYIGSADWMRRNLNSRVETVAPILDPAVQAELDQILAIYEDDNASVWDLGPDGVYRRRRPAEGEEERVAQNLLIRRARRVRKLKVAPLDDEERDARTAS